MDRIEFAKRLISEISDTSQRLADAQRSQQDLKKKIDDRRDAAIAKAAEKRKSIADRVRSSKFSKPSLDSISSKEQGATAMQKGAGNLIKTGVAAAKNVAKGAAKTAVGVGDAIKGGSNLALKFKHALAKKRTERAQKAADDDRPFAPPKSKPQTYRSKREEPKKTEPKKTEPKRLLAAKDPKRKQISGGAERKALPAAKPRKFGTDPDGTPSKGALARSSKKIRRGMMQQREEFIHEVEEKDKKDKLDKVIDIMKGKNKIKINPDMKEEVKTDNWKDNYVATEYETVDLIKPEPLNPSNWRKELDSLRP